METKNSRKIWAIVIAIIVLVIAIVAAFFIGKGANQEGESREESQEVNNDDNTDSDGKRQDDLSASEWSEDTSDVFGRSIKTPASKVGKPLGEVKKQDSLQCDVDSPEKLTIERTHDMQTLWSEDLGPGGVTKDGVPEKYARTAEAAMLAAWNSNAYLYRGGDLATSAVKTNFTGENAEKLGAELEKSPANTDEKATRRAAPQAFKITSCGDDRVIGDLALPLPTDEKGDTDNPTWIVVRMSAVWEEDDWKTELESVKQPANKQISNLDGWSEWSF
ncbi:hypothetical protein [Corynebacterium rhinophilum]|jgi:hypothetical protein|uniref:hypothetical protein n=1 Tax=Corynebacterium rhinophilum TaxID=3050197 RepID=UPI0013C5582F|nr:MULTISPECIES: hypothetical protein [unclassified Corynebacterium]MDK8648311.1 hypothetical protein [Corynebacterium sp. MSK082]MDK8702968.1 hypothetical protein [Corynebacterium sp. MSK107]CAB0884752.1 hypothetical protein FRC0402_01879 [Corynebacterium diphtheriae]HDM1313029.1 hypothetical protein [Staphylococcus aureus]